MRRWLGSALFTGALVAAFSLAACSGPSRTPARSAIADGALPQATAEPLAACSVASPPGGSVRSTARATVATFLSVFNRRRDLSRGWLAPETSAQIVAGLAPVSRLDLLSLDDHFCRVPRSSRIEFTARMMVFREPVDGVWWPTTGQNGVQSVFVTLEPSGTPTGWRIFALSVPDPSPAGSRAAGDSPGD